MTAKTTQQMGVYAIVNTLNGKVYIGSTNNLTTRFGRHRRDLARNIHRNGYLQSAYNKYGEDVFDYRILEIVTNEQDLIAREQVWIETLNACDEAFGYNLITDAERHTHCEATRAKISAAHKDKPKSDEHRTKIGAAHKGRKRTLTAEWRAKLSAAGKGRSLSLEARAKLSAALKGRKGKPQSSEARAKLSAAHKGKPKSDEHRAKISAARTGQKLSPERYERVVEMHRNRSPETRARLSEANSKFTPEQVIEIRRKAAQGQGIVSLAREYGVNHSLISEIVSGKTWKHLL
jgi:group I intron endonuclease